MLSFTSLLASHKRNMGGRGTCAYSLRSGGGETITSVKKTLAEPVVNLVSESFTEALIEDEIQARVDSSIGVRQKIK